MNEYTRRKESLQLLGFSSYRKYLRSELWHSIRAAKLKRDPECYGCGSTQYMQVHHSDYSLKVLTGEDERGLWSVCKYCHRFCEFATDGCKRSPSEATDELKRLHRTYYGRNIQRRVNRIHRGRKKRS